MSNYNNDQPFLFDFSNEYFFPGDWTLPGFSNMQPNGQFMLPYNFSNPSNAMNGFEVALPVQQDNAGYDSGDDDFYQDNKNEQPATQAQVDTTDKDPALLKPRSTARASNDQLLPDASELSSPPTARAMEVSNALKAANDRAAVLRAKIVESKFHKSTTPIKHPDQGSKQVASKLKIPAMNVTLLSKALTKESATESQLPIQSSPVSTTLESKKTISTGGGWRTKDAKSAESILLDSCSHLPFSDEIDSLIADVRAATDSGKDEKVKQSENNKCVKDRTGQATRPLGKTSSGQNEIYKNPTEKPDATHKTAAKEADVPADKKDTQHTRNLGEDSKILHSGLRTKEKPKPLIFTRTEADYYRPPRDSQFESNNRKHEGARRLPDPQSLSMSRQYEGVRGAPDPRSMSIHRQHEVVGRASDIPQSAPLPQRWSAPFLDSSSYQAGVNQQRALTSSDNMALGSNENVIPSRHADEDVQLWLEITGFFDEEFRRSHLARHHKLVELDKQREELLEEEMQETTLRSMRARTHAAAAKEESLYPRLDPSKVPDFGSLRLTTPTKREHSPDPQKQGKIPRTNITNVSDSRRVSNQDRLVAPRNTGFLADGITVDDRKLPNDNANRRSPTRFDNDYSRRSPSSRVAPSPRFNRGSWERRGYDNRDGTYRGEESSYQSPMSRGRRFDDYIRRYRRSSPRRGY